MPAGAHTLLSATSRHVTRRHVPDAVQTYVTLNFVSVL